MGFVRTFIGKKLVNYAKNEGHKPAEIPSNEIERLKDLKRLKLIEKNIKKDKRFSSFPKLAAVITDCNQSAIHIIDNDTLHCKVSFGKDLITDVMTKEAPRDLTICSHVLNNNSNKIYTYTHNAYRENIGKICVALNVQVENDNPEASLLGKNSRISGTCSMPFCFVYPL